MPESTFYSAAASTSFALLGFWWVVVSQRYRDWMKIRSRRRQAYSISLYFMLPALMSLGALVGPPSIWRLAFGFSALLGLAEVIAASVSAGKDGLGTRPRVFLALTVPIYLVIGAVAIHPQLPDNVGFSLKPLETEAIVVVLLLLVGVNFAWALLFEQAPEAAAGGID
jgi:hypothetical protein